MNARRTAIAVIVATAATLTLISCVPTRTVEHPDRPIPTPGAMTDADFWQIITAARGTADPQAPSARPHDLRRVLAAKSDSEIAAFAARFGAELTRLDRWAVWDAGYAASAGMADDDFHYFRSWLIGKGPIVVDQVMSDPDGLVADLADEDWTTDELQNEELEYVAPDLLAKHFGQDAAEDFAADVAAAADDDPVGRESTEASIARRHPLLTAWAEAHAGD